MERRDQDQKPDELEEAKPPLKLRPEYIPVTRLSKKALIAIGGGFAIVLGGATLFALQSGSSNAPVAELFTTDQKPSADGLAALPKDYASVPKLGPPLPGDLGGPIVDAGAQYELPPPAAAAPPPVDPAIAEAKRQKESARKAGLFAQNQNRSSGPLPDQPQGASQQPSVARTSQMVSTERLQSLTSPFVLLSGSILSAALVSGVRSDVEGQVTAQVTHHAYDSLTGQHLLVPQGSKLIGSYRSDIAFGAERLGISWQRILLPNGKSLLLNDLPASDAGGYAGLQDRVDHHWDRLGLAASLSTILSIGAQIGSSGDSDIARAIRDGLSDSFGRTGDEIVKRQLAIKPTVTIRPGMPVRVLVGKDLVLEPYRRQVSVQ